MRPIIVIGAGSAGVVSAIGLKKLGYEVIIVNKKRPFCAIEGLSFRTLQGFRNAGCTNVLNLIKEASARRVIWNGNSSEDNYEYVVNRGEFDEALLKDVKNFGIDALKGVAKIIDYDKQLIRVNDIKIKAEFIVDARGRFASRRIKKKSKPTNAFLLRYKKQTKSLKTFLYTSKFGWIWEAQDGKNLSYLQLVADTRQGKKFIKEIIEEKNDVVFSSSNLIIRDASSYISKNLIASNYIRIGDAACAIDPLSGNGIFQSLSTALISPYVINTILKGNKEDKKAAKEFFVSRVEDIFYRYTRLGREFYEKEKQFNTKFWMDRSSWPDLKESHKQIEEPYIRRKWILQAPFIKASDVVIANNNPMGVWKLDEIDLVEITKKALLIPKINREEYIQKIIDKKGLDLVNTNNLLKWCKESLLT